MLEIGDQYATSWTSSEYFMMDVGDAAVLAGVVAARAVVEASTGRRNVDIRPRRRIVIGSGKSKCLQRQWLLISRYVQARGKLLQLSDNSSCLVLMLSRLFAVALIQQSMAEIECRLSRSGIRGDRGSGGLVQVDCSFRQRDVNKQ